MTSMLPRPIWLLILGALAVVAVGCGGGSSRLSEDDFLDQFDDACNQADEDIQDLDSPESGNFDQQKDVFEEAKGIIDDALADFEDITPPEDLQDEYDDAIAALEDGQDVLDDLIAAAEDEDQDEIDDLGGDYTETVDDFRSAVDDLGSECSVLEDQSEDISTDTSTDFSTDFSTDTSTDFSTDFSSDFSTDFSDGVPTLGAPVPPEQFIPEYGSNPQFDADADACYQGSLAACDELYGETPISPDFNSYEGYGNSCGGRLAEEYDGSCVELG